jgi:hypothetical protein
MLSKEENIHFLHGSMREVLSGLTPQTQAKWGRMDAQQMFEHLQLSLQLSVGKIKIDISTPLDKVEKIKRIALLSDRPLQINFQNPALPVNPIPYIHEDFEKAFLALWNELDGFMEFYSVRNSSFTLPHVVFGQLNYEEWLWFHNKHFTHHATQFGLIEKTE